MQMLKKLFNSEKKYYLELDEVKDSEVVQTAVKTAEKTAQVVKEKAQEVVESEPVRSAVKTASEVVDTAQEKVASVIDTDESKSDKTKPVETKPAEDKKVEKDSKTAAKNGKAASPKAKKAGEEEAGGQDKPAQSTANNAGASSFDPPFWVAAMNNTNNKAATSNGAVEGETFAENNLMPTMTKYRRRPGGSLNKFKDMAKTAKTPRR